MTKNDPDKPLEKQDPGKTGATAKTPGVPQNLVTPVTVHETWDEIYARESKEEEEEVLDYREKKDGSILLSKQSLEKIKKKLDAAKRMKTRHLRILKAYEELANKHEQLVKEREHDPRPRPAVRSPGVHRLGKVSKRMRKLTIALAGCGWYQTRRRARLIKEMEKAIKYLNR